MEKKPEVGRIKMGHLFVNNKRKRELTLVEVQKTGQDELHITAYVLTK